MKVGSERFIDFADIYNEGRPRLPKLAIEILKKYLDRDIDLIVDIGAGTGNSTEICTEIKEVSRILKKFVFYFKIRKSGWIIK